MPKLIELQKKYAGLGDRFAIIAMHNSDVESLDELDQKLEGSKPWSGDLPFPQLLDDQWKTYETYTMSMYPTIIVLDPEGRIVASPTIPLFEEKLRAMSKADKR